MEFILVILPVLLVFLVGYIGQRTLHIDPKNISKMALYLLMPFLVFRTFYENELNSTYLYLTIFALGLCFGLISLVYALSYIKKYTRKESSSLILASAFMNNGNYGTPVALFAFGVAGFDIAIILMVIQSLIMTTVGIYYAAKGSEEKQTGILGSLMAVAKMPTVYAAILGISFQFLPVHVPDTFYKSINLVADATIPTVMIILGMQLATIRIKHLEIEKMSYSLVLKLVISPLIAFLFAWILPVSDLVANIIILMAAMPSAANTTMMSLEFNTKPEFVSSVTLVSTLASVITLPIILALIL
ncbi:AEC family transporter [Bacillus pinisoli]|uniref:AEC family transporter n=1 Tax=Bacillus pinisoli TaxID=2901866 RepID=UPI001FF64911